MVGFILTLIFGAGVEVFLNEGFIIRVPVRAFHRHAALRQSYLRNGKTRSQGSDTPSLAAPIVKTFGNVANAPARAASVPQTN